jgi:[histone H3]-dimethyl/trimethyl-L-lysine36 demethylase
MTGTCVVAADDTRLPQLWASLCAAGGAAPSRLLQTATASPSTEAATQAAAAAEACWERLHLGDWSTVPVAWRDAYTLATLLLAQHMADIKACVRALDMAALVGGNLFRPELDDALTAALSSLDDDERRAKRQRVKNGDANAGRALGHDEPLTGDDAVVLPDGAGRGGVPTDELPSMERFATCYMSPSPGQPVLLTGLLSDWPALRLWSNAQYLMTVAGERTVPVELGEHYLSPSWSQQLMTLREFLDAHVVGNRCNATTRRGYLAQHPLFEQVPALARDIRTPEYCSLGSSDKPAACNAWLGPAGTVTPLHTDPHHNLLCQVVGVKHVRLYAPSCTPLLYPHTQGHVKNSSRVDVRHVDDAQFPLFKEAPFIDVDLRAGQVRWHNTPSPGCRLLACDAFLRPGALHPASLVALCHVADDIILREFLLGLRNALSASEAHNIRHSSR